MTGVLEFAELVRKPRGEMIAVVAGMLQARPQARTAYLSQALGCVTKPCAVDVTYDYVRNYCRASIGLAEDKAYYTGLAAMTSTTRGRREEPA